MKNYRDTIGRSKNKGTKKLIEVVIIENFYMCTTRIRNW